jgi:putative ABC transport system substrate-binding protein
VASKRLELLRELVPRIGRLAVLVNPSNATISETMVRDVKAGAHGMGLQVQVFNASTSREIDAAFADLLHERSDAVFVGGDAFFTSRRVQFATLAARYMIPSSFSQREYTEAGGLMSYATNIRDTYRQAGVYVDRILKGVAKPADLPVVQSTKARRMNANPNETVSVNAEYTRAPEGRLKSWVSPKAYW